MHFVAQRSAGETCRVAPTWNLFVSEVSEEGKSANLRVFGRLGGICSHLLMVLEAVVGLRLWV